jgi:hypothetical protein
MSVWLSSCVTPERDSTPVEGERADAMDVHCLDLCIGILECVNTLIKKKRKLGLRFPNWATPMSGALQFRNESVASLPEKRKSNATTVVCESN